MRGRPSTTAACAFCGKDEKDAALIHGISGSICSYCAAVAKEAFDKKETDAEVKLDFKPRDVASYLDQHVVGQEHAKKILSVAVYNHHKRLSKKLTTGKSNIWLIGPSGTGKTLMAELVAKYVDVPMVSIDCTTITEAGYVGDDPEMIVARLFNAAKQDHALASKGLVFLDEVDKLVASKNDTTRDVRGRGVQQSLLKMIEGCDVTFNPSGRKKSSGETVETINTKDMLFILGGAFVGLDNVRTRKGMGIGQNPHKTKTKGPPTSDELVSYGMIPELVGRVPIVAELYPLGQAQMEMILSVVKNNLLSQYAELMAAEGVSLTFTPGFVTKVARLALKSKGGARSLRTIMEASLLDLMYDPATTEVVLDEKDVREP